jgi:hypothetical protein
MTVLNKAVNDERGFDVLDVGSAYLQVDMDTVQYVRVSAQIANLLAVHDARVKDYMADDGTILVTLKKALYGLRQSGRLWYEKLQKLLLDFGFERSKHDLGLFIKGDLVVTCWVDDLLVLGSREERDELNKYLKANLRNVDVQTDPDECTLLGMSLRWEQAGYSRHPSRAQSMS